MLSTQELTGGTQAERMYFDGGGAGGVSVNARLEEWGKRKPAGVTSISCLLL